VPADDLNAPLGQNSRKARRFKLPVSPAVLVASALGGVLVIFFGWALITSDPMGGEPAATVAMPPAAKTALSGGAKRVAAAPSTQAAAPQESAAGQGVVTIIDGSTGKRQEVPINGGTVRAAAPSGGESRLLESSRHGMIPKIAADGTRPSDAYAKPVQTDPTRTDAPRIAIVVTGLGIGAKLTAEAIDKLPGPVTLAFPPYGPDAGANAVRARAAGHEILMQLAMEPFDYPDNDPGPQTLLTSLTLEQNIDRLYWMMSRFQGYVGVTNYMGARFTATELAFVPILKEVSKRGLIYFDDGTSPRSVAAQIAGGTHLAFAKADVAIDAVPAADEIARALVRLETAARSNGVAIGTVSALPLSIEKVAQWAKSAEGRGFVLVPISAAAARGKSS
jgi:polysaccharide deacetylase 2 family uncharacterized protein YibQ